VTIGLADCEWMWQAKRCYGRQVMPHRLLNEGLSVHAFTPMAMSRIPPQGATNFDFEFANLEDVLADLR